MKNLSIILFFFLTCLIFYFSFGFFYERKFDNIQYLNFDIVDTITSLNLDEKYKLLYIESKLENVIMSHHPLNCLNDSGLKKCCVDINNLISQDLKNNGYEVINLKSHLVYLKKNDINYSVYDPFYGFLIIFKQGSKTIIYDFKRNFNFVSFIPKKNRLILELNNPILRYYRINFNQKNIELPIFWTGK